MHYRAVTRWECNRASLMRCLLNRQRVRGLMEYKTVTAGTREDGGQGVIEDSVELVAVLDAQVNDAIRLGWRPVGVVVTGPDGRLNQSMVRVR